MGGNPLYNLYEMTIKNMNYQMSRVNQYLVRNNHPGIISREKFVFLKGFEIRKQRIHTRGRIILLVRMLITSIQST